MPSTDLKFFTNEPERTLYDRFNKILQTHTQYFDVIVGYFRTSGFFRLYHAMKDVEKIRILVGLNTDSATVDLIEQSRVSTVVMSQKEYKQKYGDQIEREFEESEDSKEVEDGVRCFVEWLKSGKLELRMYTEQPIHAKVYIMRKDPAMCDYYGSVITGSSNFSYSGLVNNLEFNVELKDSPDVQFALERFEELWAKGVDVSSVTQDTIENRTWIKDNITPYELYLKTIFEYFDDEINADQIALINELFPEGYMRLQYQIDAIIQARNILEKYNGVFISDVVGLGKTYICALLAKSLKNTRRLIICPPVLVDYWESVLKDFDVVIRLESNKFLKALYPHEPEDSKKEINNYYLAFLGDKPIDNYHLMSSLFDFDIGSYIPNITPQVESFMGKLVSIIVHILTAAGIEIDEPVAAIKFSNIIYADMNISRNYINFGIHNEPAILMAFLDILCTVNSYNEVFANINTDRRFGLKVKYLVLFDSIIGIKTLMEYCENNNINLGLDSKDKEVV